jgi:Na+/H+ antiporter NhaD/arsenite permease-like protein
MNPLRIRPITGLLAAAWIGLASPAFAAAELDGRAMTLLWAAPFAGLLLSIALLPLWAPGFWHHHYGKVAVAWAAAFAVPATFVFGPSAAFGAFAHILLLDYVPFIVMLTTLFTVAGGVRVHGRLGGTPASNTAMLAFGTVIAGWMGTTGASMLLIRPMIWANQHRTHRVHVFVFFIFLVSNIGGVLSPLGDPPLFLGFLKGVSFFWWAGEMVPILLFVGGATLLVFFLIDTWLARRDEPSVRAPKEPISIEGGLNLVLLVAVVGAVLVAGAWKSGVSYVFAGMEFPLQMLVSQALLLTILGVSILFTSKETRAHNEFSYAPMKEVAKLFFGIFITIIPPLAILRAGSDGSLAWLLALVTKDGQPVDAAYFWLTGGLSGFLDNAPSFLVFFNAAGGDPEVLMGPLARTLAAISAGAVFMGALSYIGNAPNFMVKAVVEDRGIEMPSFFGYMAWSCAVLLPIFVVATFLFYW